MDFAPALWIVTPMIGPIFLAQRPHAMLRSDGEMRLRVDEDCIIAVTGREPSLDVDGNAKTTYQSQHVPAGATITFGSALLGSKAYLAIGGNWHVPKAVGSAYGSTRTTWWVGW